MLPGLVSAHVHLASFAMPNALRGEALYLKMVESDAQNRSAADTCTAGVTTVRGVDGYSDGLFMLNRALKADICPRRRWVG